MREFVIVAHEAPLHGDFELDDLPGAGRVDLLVRCVGAGLFTSHDIREDSRVHLVIRDEVTVAFDGREIRNARPDERSLAGLLRSALDRVEDTIGEQPVEVGPGLTVRRRGLDSTVSELERHGTVLCLHEDGQPLASTPPPKHPVFVLSDHRDFTEPERSLFQDRVETQVSVGPEVIHADHATTAVHNWLDTEAYSHY
jgi:tRNA (pseudouridine54-N1)-methyltransferase